MANNENTNGSLVNQMEEYPPNGEELSNGKKSVTSPVASNGGGSEYSPLHMETEKTVGPWHADGLKVIIVSCLVFSASITVALIITIYYGSPQVSDHGSVATNSPVCAKIGTDVLDDDGSAVDAAIAVVFCEGVINSHLTGIGGGGFMVYRNHKEKDNFGLDFRERAPSGALLANYVNNKELLKLGSTAAGVPGLVKGLGEAHSRYGKKSWYSLIMPAVNLAMNGFTVMKPLYTAINQVINSYDMKKFKSLTDTYFINNKAPNIGDTLRLPKLGKVLQEIADNGPDVFYNGKIAQDIVSSVKKDGGYIKIKDLKDYRVHMPELISSTFKDRILLTLPPPAGGATVMAALNVMDVYGVTKHNATFNLTYHRFIEAMKFAEKLHDTLGDPMFVKEAINITKNMISQETAKAIREKILDNSTQNISYYGTSGFTPSQGTSHVSVFGPNEDIVSLTSSINDKLGSLFVTDNGILLNNELLDFSLPNNAEPNKNNFVEPGKAPMSSMSPTIVYTDSEPCGHRLAIGAINGMKIPAGIAETLLDFLGFDWSLEESVAHARLYPFVSQAKNKVVEYEEGFDPAIIASLESKGHKMVKATIPPNLVYAAMKVNEDVSAVGDPRHNSTASVF